MTTTTAPAPAPVLSDSDAGLIHTVSSFQHFLRVLHVKTPRALCGELLIGDPDRRPVLRNDPRSPRCAALTGPDVSLTWIPGSAR